MVPGPHPNAHAFPETYAAYGVRISGPWSNPRWHRRPMAWPGRDRFVLPCGGLRPPQKGGYPPTPRVRGQTPPRYTPVPIFHRATMTFLSSIALGGDTPPCLGPETPPPDGSQGGGGPMSPRTIGPNARTALGGTPRPPSHCLGLSHGSPPFAGGVDPPFPGVFLLSHPR